MFSSNVTSSLTESSIGEEGKPFSLHNRLDVRDQLGYWQEVLVLQVNKTRVQVASQQRPEDAEWISKESDRIAPVGRYSGAFGKAKVEGFIDGRGKSFPDYAEGREDNVKLRRPVATDQAEEVKGTKEKTPSALYQNLKNREAQFEQKLVAKGLKIKVVAGDGNCLFRAISDQVYGKEEYHGMIREHCMNYISVEKEYFSQYIVGGMDAFTDYVSAKRQNGEWGDDLEIEAMSEMYGRPIEIYAYDDKPMRTFHEGVFSAPGQRSIKLSYHGRSHFNSVCGTT